MSEKIEREYCLPSDYHAIVLLVDDQPFVSEAVRRAFKDQPDISYHYCADPQKAVAMANYLKPTVVLLDLIMPGVGGLHLLRALRCNAQTKEVPIIMLSSQEEARAKSDSFALGANDYLVKLPDTVELRARVRYHSQSYQHRLQRDAAFTALKESQQQLLRKNTELAVLNQKFSSALSELQDLGCLLPLCEVCKEPRKDLVHSDVLRKYLAESIAALNGQMECDSCRGNK